MAVANSCEAEFRDSFFLVRKHNAKTMMMPMIAHDGTRAHKQ